ncbi:hypothetical protein [Nostoc sp.]
MRYQQNQRLLVLGFVAQTPLASPKETLRVACSSVGVQVGKP